LFDDSLGVSGGGEHLTSDKADWYARLAHDWDSLLNKGGRKAWNDMTTLSSEAAVLAA
jgi:hypothetical protein